MNKRIFNKKKFNKTIRPKEVLLGDKKSKISILAGIVGDTDIKTREPKEKGIWSFRINKQFRAFCKLENDLLIVFKIDNHQ